MNARLERVIRGLLLFFVFVLPWHTAYILHQGVLGKEGDPLFGVWQYGTIALYGLDFFVGALLVLFMVWTSSQFRVVGLKGVRSFLTPQTWLLAFLVLVAFFSVLWSPDPRLAVVMSGRLAEGIFIYALLRSFSPSALLLSWSWIGAGVIQAVLGLTQYVVQEVSANKWLGMAFHSSKQLGDFVVENADSRWLRAYGSFPHPNMEGAFLGIALIACVYALSKAKGRLAQLALIFSANILVAGLLVTFSRSALLSLSVALLVLIIAWVLKRRARQAEDRQTQSGLSPLTVACVSCLVTIGVFSFTLAEPFSVRLGVGGWKRLEQRSINERLGSVTNAMPLVSRSLVQGTGMGQYTLGLHTFDQSKALKRPAYWYQPIHSTYLMILAELGILGAMLFAGFFLLYFGCLIRNGIIFENMIGLALGIFILSIGMFEHYWWTLPTGIFLFWSALATSALYATVRVSSNI